MLVTKSIVVMAYPNILCENMKKIFRHKKGHATINLKYSLPTILTSTITDLIFKILKYCMEIFRIY